MIAKIKKHYHQTRRKLAKFWLDINLQLTVVGITGSFGKTTTSRAIAEVLRAKYSTNMTDINLDTNYNLPITILKTKLWDQALVLEYGIDHLGEMDAHLSLVRPKIAVLTGLSPVHADKELLGSFENIIAEKRKLVEATAEDGLALFNYDDPKVREIGQSLKKAKLFYGLSKKADLWADNIKVTLEGTEFTLHDQVRDLKTEIKTGLLGYPAVYACLVAYGVGRQLGVEKKAIVQKLSGLKPLSGRLSLEKGPMGTILLNDARRANPASTIVGLQSLSQLPGRKVVVLGEMGELGEYGQEMHRQVGVEVARLKMDIVVGVGPLTKYIIEEAAKKGLKKSQLFWAKDVAEAAEILGKVLKKGDLFYLKASLLRHLERIVLLLEGQKVACKEVVCHHYGLCPTCPSLSGKVE